MKQLEERSLVVKETGEKIPFSDIEPGNQMHRLITGWEKGESVTIQGVMSDQKWFSGAIAQQVNLAADFVSGEETEDGDVYLGTAQKHPVVSIGEMNTSTTLTLAKGRGGVVMQL